MKPCWKTVLIRGWLCFFLTTSCPWTTSGSAESKLQSISFHNDNNNDINSNTVEKGETRTKHGRAEGKTFGFIADLFLSAHCFLEDCRHNLNHAAYCCSQNRNHVCCQYSFQYGAAFAPLLGASFGGGASYGAGAVLSQSLPPQPFIYPPASSVVPSSLNLHHHEHFMSGGGPGGGMYKPGQCPAIRGYYNSGIGGYGSGLIGASGGYRRGHGVTYVRDTYLPGDNLYNRPGYDLGRGTCSYDYECPGAEKCCHVERRRGLYSMACRHPSRDFYY